MRSTAAKRLESWFDREIIVPPTGFNAVHLYRALASLCGYSDFKDDRHTNKLKEWIGRHKHYLFVLIDGLGLNHTRILPKNGFFEKHLSGEMKSVFPSTTATALTSFSTGQWPSDHGIVGWNTHLPEHGITILPLKASERITRSPIRRYGFSLSSIIHAESIFPMLATDNRIFIHKRHRSGEFAKWAYPAMPRSGYKNLNQIAERLAGATKKNIEPSFTYLYIEDIDSMSHKNGWGDDKVRSLVCKIDGVLGALREQLPPNTRMVVSSDHGHINIPENRHRILKSDNRLLEYLHVPPSGESRMPIFHVIEGKEKQFLHEFESQYGEAFLLLTPDDVEQCKLLGPGPLNRTTRERLGSWIGIAAGADAIEFVPAGRKSNGNTGMHGGLSEHEMRIPLFLA